MPILEWKGDEIVFRRQGLLTVGSVFKRSLFVNSSYFSWMVFQAPMHESPLVDSIITAVVRKTSIHKRQVYCTYP